MSVVLTTRALSDCKELHISTNPFLFICKTAHDEWDGSGKRIASFRGVQGEAVQ
jgi:hypothetical protein